MRLRAKEDLPQIPWAKEARVVWSNGHVTLERGTVTVQVHDDGDIWISRDSKEDIKDHMKKDEVLTGQLRAWIEDCPHSRDSACIREWITKPEVALLAIPEGFKEWRPPGAPRLPWEIGDYGHEDTSNIDSWIGDPFEYFHFFTDDGREGLVVIWRSERPEVWMGAASDFLSSQDEYDVWGEDALGYYNELMENGILWALDHYGLFEEDPDLLKPGILDLVEADPDLLWGELVEKLVPLTPRLPKQLRAALQVWLTRRRIESERAGRQKYLWPRLYPKEIWRAARG